MKSLKLFGLTFLLITTASTLLGMEDQIAALEQRLARAKGGERVFLRKKLEDLKAEAARRPTKVEEKEEPVRPVVVRPAKPVATLEELKLDIRQLVDQIRKTDEDVAEELFGR